jgi:Fur family transcriptional regulator, peroxide stress response regulator
MKVKTQDVKERMAHFAEVCRTSGIKLTHQRIEIFREVAQTGDHPDAERVYQGVRKRMPTVSLDTVYRTLWMLKDLGLVNTLGTAREKTRFDANLRPHHHFVCVRCGLTLDLACHKFDKLSPPESAKKLGQAETIHVEVRGTCLECDKNANETTKELRSR